ncbi:PLP-dependent cysteine synthase family protein [Pseudobacteroides cellulosolvens]|uniref:Cysteine synthase n=1 Tax=Pseudobacteroides cellulosolvens ATCC 35603 = DSM 2933 TaxID=398512 RepID=A0A0L6JKV4_9FIRM|nr:cysteine synthase family protein [Pseudobacteroides cellulosolvens]KNY26424.1 Cysteine synthase [Pseudobacteroides cellulosolvens ATCC 35603 = DSM 2933]
MIVYNDILETIGNTPIVKVNKLPEEGKRKNIFVKLECFNPGRSVKDRIALNIIDQAEKENLLSNRSVIVESSSGNTGIGLSMVSRVRDYPNVIVIDQNCPAEKIKILKALGATIVMLTTDKKDSEDLTERRIEFVNEVKKTMENIFIPNQYENRNAPIAHYLNTGEEIVRFMEETGIRFDAIFLSVGTGGTITGVSKKIKEYDSSIKIIGVEPEGSTLFGGEKGSYLQQGPGNYFKPKNLVYDHIDQGIKVSDQDAFNMCRKFALKEGVLVGGSSGGVLYTAVEMSRQFEGNILCILPDGGEKYLDSIYSDEWLRNNGITLDKENENPIQILNIDGVKDYSVLVNCIKEEVFGNEHSRAI